MNEVIDPSSDADSVARLLSATLEAVVSAFAAADIGLPERQFFSTHSGEQTIDCEQVAVTLLQIFQGSPGVPPGQAVKCESMRSAVLAVQVIRCAPKIGARGSPPTPDELMDSAVQVSRDMWMLLNVPPLVDEMGGGVLADVSVIGPQGGFTGAHMNLTVTIP